MTEDTSPNAAEPAPEAGPPTADAPMPPTPEELDALAAERDELRDLLLRKTAEFDNYRKRVDRERQTTAQTAAADLIIELLPLIDDLERALAAEADAGAAQAYRTGVELIHRQLLELLARRGVTPLETAGEQFDPHQHEAVAHEESADHEPGQIIDELRRGYVMGSRLLRAAMVRVARA